MSAILALQDLTITTKYGHYEHVSLTSPGRYGDGTPAYVLIGSPDGYPEEIARITVAMQLKPAEGCFWVKTWSENEGLLEELERLGLVERTGRFQPAGFANAIEVRPAGNLARAIEDGTMHR